MKKEILRNRLTVVLALMIMVPPLNAGAETAAVPEMGQVELTVVSIDEFGDAVLDISSEDFSALDFEDGDSINAYFSGGTILMDIPVYDFFYGLPESSLICTFYDDLVFGSIEESFAGLTGVSEGETVLIELAEKGAYLDELDLYSLPQAMEQEDWQTDEQFANFRMVHAGRIKEGILYRSATPVKLSYNRAEILSKIFAEYGIKTAINLAEGEEILEELRAGAPELAPVYDSVEYRFVPMGIDFDSEEARAAAAEVIRIIRDEEGPYLYHCHLGQDRTGFISLLLELLCGASCDEVREDYMKTYANLYGFTKENAPEKYEYFAGKADRMVEVITGEEIAEANQSQNLEEYAEKYLMEAGLTAEDIETVRKKLCGTGQPATP